MTRAMTYWLLLAVFAAPLASAQPAAAPEPIVTATIDPPRVVVGQKATLLVTVLAPNYMPSPPVLPEFQLRNVVTRPLGAINQVETRDGVTYAGVRYEFAVFPQEPGSFAIAGQKVTVTYAADPPQSRTATIELPRLAFEGFIPDAAQGLDPFVAATSLSVEQVVKQSSQELKVGDSVTRTVTIKAEGTLAMLLPPVAFSEISGLARYPAQPSLQRTSIAAPARSTVGDIIHYSYLVTNTGNVTLTAPFTVADDRSTDEACPATATARTAGLDHLHRDIHDHPGRSGRWRGHQHRATARRTGRPDLADPTARP